MARNKNQDVNLIETVAAGLSFADSDMLAGLLRVDATPGMPDHPIVMPGDIWTLGEHRLICGDSTDAATVRALLGSDRPRLMVTDPPYGVDYSPDWRNQALRADGSAIGGRARAVGIVANDARVDWSGAWRLFPGDAAYVWHASMHGGEVVQSLEMCGFRLRSLIVWNKTRFVIGRGDYHWKHEMCLYAVRKGAKSGWNGARDQSTVWDIRHTVSDSGHGTQKPVECMRRPMENNSAPGDLVYEPFCGSGTTIIAAEETHRRCRAVELNPLYAYVSIVRWQNYVGRPATLNGESFADVTRRRLAEPESRKIIQAPTSAQTPETIGDFDPVLAELMCEWYCPLGGAVIDVASDEIRRRVFEHLRRSYNQDGSDADLVIFATPASIDDISAAVARLRNDRFAVAVVNDIRAADGWPSGLPRAVANEFAKCGLRLFDEGVYVGDSALEPGLDFSSHRTMTRAHTNMMTFVKGDRQAAIAACDLQLDG